MKQLILLILVTGMVATSAFGQTAVTGSAPQPVSCVNDPLHPIAGKPYDYSAVLNPAGGSTYWYATKSTTFVTAGVRSATEILADGTTIMSGATNYRTLGSGATSPNATNVTWSSAGLKGVDATTNPLFMVLEYKGPTCSNNMKVYQILPKNAFTVDILNLKNGDKSPLAYGATDTQCYADIASAKFVSPNMVYDYGVNKMYFEVVAANFTKAFTPSFKLSGLKTGQSALVEWTVDKTFASGLTALGAAQNATTGTPLSFAGQVVNTNVSNTTVGVSIYVRVTITNGLYEGLTDDAIALAVEAVNDSAEPDIDNATCAAPASTYEDIATQTLNMRPTVTSVPATGAFVVQTLP
ncbi:MAG: hypothetical protein M0Q53_07875 [Prolixibacteraceae bacterium]|jgi:hypothetical protein|nr:hypothetical protein [Prolixibacteraceae bacterium]